MFNPTLIVIEHLFENFERCTSEPTRYWSPTILGS